MHLLKDRGRGAIVLPDGTLFGEGVTKGATTKEIWFYEHPYPNGAKSYNKTKPIRIEEFQPEKAWWQKREKNERAWKVSIDEIKASGYNLDIKNPSVVNNAHRDPDDSWLSTALCLMGLHRRAARLKMSLKLSEMILELAVRGKLVAQDEGNEQAAFRL